MSPMTAKPKPAWRGGWAAVAVPVVTPATANAMVAPRTSRRRTGETPVVVRSLRDLPPGGGERRPRAGNVAVESRDENARRRSANSGGSVSDFRERARWWRARDAVAPRGRSTYPAYVHLWRVR